MESSTRVDAPIISKAVGSGGTTTMATAPKMEPGLVNVLFDKYKGSITPLS